MFNPLGTLFGKVMSGIAVVLLLAVAVQTIRIEHLQTIIAKLRGDNKALRLNLDQVKEATQRADKAARDAKARTEAEYKRKAELTDAKHQSELEAARRRAAAYADRNRVPAPPGGAPSRSTPAPGGNTPEGADGRGEDSGVVVTRDDFNTLVDNTLRLKAAREWACGLEGAKCD